jgi:3-hydroxybutyryl-CoA dehydrogenase
MNILVVGGEAHLHESQQKFGSEHQYHRLSKEEVTTARRPTADVIFDFVSSSVSEVSPYNGFTGGLFVNACQLSLAEFFPASENRPSGLVCGFNGMPTFLNRELLEISLRDQQQLLKVEKLCGALNTAFRIVDDRVGLVSGRIIALVINEAYYAAQEGIASRDDIDKAMRLGTNYPWGPFEWAERIGLPYVYQLIESLYRDTHDERYKVCPLLKKEYLLQRHD